MSKRIVICLVVALGAALGAFALRQWALRDEPITTDENSYVFQATLMAHGRLRHPFPGCGRAFSHEMIVLDPSRGWFSRYPPGHPLWLAPGVWMGRPHLMVGLAAFIGVLVVSATAWRLGSSPVPAAFLTAVSPFFLLTHGTLLSHTTGFLAAALLVLGYILLKQTVRPAAGMLAGAAWGWLFLNRTFGAACLAPVLAVDGLIWWWSVRRKGGKPLAAVTAFAGAAAVVGGVLFLYNYLLLGDPLLMTHSFYDSGDAPGFGGQHGHTLLRGLTTVGQNLLLLDRWMWGGHGGLAVVGALAAVGWRRSWSPWLLACPVAVWAGHVLFWYEGPRETGPGYFFETLPFLAAAGSLGGAALAGKLGAGRAKAVAVAACLAAVASGSVFVWRKGGELRAEQKTLAELRQVVRSAPTNALVMANPVKKLYTHRIHGPLVFNPDGLRSEPLVGRVDTAFGEAALRRMFPGRAPLFLNLQHRVLLPVGDPSELVWCIDLRDVRIDPSARKVEDGRVTALRIPRGDAVTDMLLHGVVHSLPVGQFELAVDLLWKAGAGKEVAEVSVVEAGTGRVLVRGPVTAGADGSGGVTVRLPFRMERSWEVEPRVRRIGQGELALTRAVVTEAAK